MLITFSHEQCSGQNSSVSTSLGTLYCLDACKDVCVNLVAFRVCYANSRKWLNIPFKHYQGETFIVCYINSCKWSDVPSNYCLIRACSSSPQLTTNFWHSLWWKYSTVHFRAALIHLCCLEQLFLHPQCINSWHAWITSGKVVNSGS